MRARYLSTDIKQLAGLFRAKGLHTLDLHDCERKLGRRLKGVERAAFVMSQDSGYNRQVVRQAAALQEHIRVQPKGTRLPKPADYNQHQDTGHRLWAHKLPQ